MHSSSSLTSSRLPDMRSKTPEERRVAIASAYKGSQPPLEMLSDEAVLPLELADGMIENVIGTFELPLGVATNFLINGKEYLVPMAVEEPSVVAAASFMARLARENGGFRSQTTRPIMRAQIQLLGITDPHGARQRLLMEREQIISLANAQDQFLVELGGGCKDIEVHIFEKTAVGNMVVLHILVDVRDAMGANAVNTMAEAVAPFAAQISGGTPRLRILSNLADQRLVRTLVKIKPESLSTTEFDGHAVAMGMVEACTLAEVDPYRAATHNKGIMNGIDPLVVATGNDWRAVEAGAHAWAARDGRYTSLTRWEINSDGTLVGTIELPMALGLVGGATKTHPAAQAALAMLNVETANELSQVAGAVGLAQNMAALRALATEGIQRGHMALHARNIAIAAGASGVQIDKVARSLIAAGQVSTDRAREIISELAGA